MNLTRWKLRSQDYILKSKLQRQYSISNITANVLAARIKDGDFPLNCFMCDNIESFSCLKDMEKAARYINKAISSGKKIAVFGDYDCDGICACVILYKYFRYKGVDIIPYIPERNGGYGLNVEAIDFLKSEGVELIITVDTAIVAFDEALYANSLGINLIITDHHIVGESLPKALAVVDPKRTDDGSCFKDICGAYLAFKLVAAVENKPCDYILKHYVDLLAIATVADVMPLVGENRVIVKKGLYYIKNTENIGLRELLKLCYLCEKDIFSSDIAFKICPMLNATGRLNNARLSFELLVCNNKEEAKVLAKKVSSYNIKRRSIQDVMVREAIDMVLKDELFLYSNVIVVLGNSWEVGLIGILAARLMRIFKKPVFVLAKDGEFLKGSARSFEGFSVYDALKHLSRYFTQWGGHVSAGGFTLKESNFLEFKAALHSFSLKITPDILTLKIDCVVNPKDLDIGVVKDLYRLAPFGCGNKEPIFLIKNVMLKEILVVGANKKHLKLVFELENFEFKVLFFNFFREHFHFKLGSRLDILVNVIYNKFKGNDDFYFQMVDIRPSNLNQGDIIKDFELFRDIISGTKNFKLVDCFKRCDFVYVYNIFKKIKVFYGNVYSLYLVLHGKGISYFKLCVIIRVFIMEGILVIKDMAIYFYILIIVYNKCVVSF